MLQPTNLGVMKKYPGAIPGVMTVASGSSRNVTFCEAKRYEREKKEELSRQTSKTTRMKKLFLFVLTVIKETSLARYFKHQYNAQWS